MNTKFCTFKEAKNFLRRSELGEMEYKQIRNELDNENGQSPPIKIGGLFRKEQG